MESKIQLWGVTIQIPHTPVPEVSLTILLNNPKATSRHRTESPTNTRGQREARLRPHTHCSQTRVSRAPWGA